MYRLNLLQRNVLITSDEVIFHAPTKHTLDHRTIENSIIIAEERFIRPALGHAYYEAMITEKNLLITSGNLAAQQALINASLPDGSPAQTLEAGMVVNAAEYLSAGNLSLWKEILWKLTAECVLLIAAPENFIHFSSEGLVHNAPTAGPMIASGVVTPDLRSVKWLMDKKMQDRIDPLREALHAWICTKKKADSTVYPLYTKYCDCDINGVAYKRKTDIITTIYDEEDDNSCCNGWGFPYP